MNMERHSTGRFRLAVIILAVAVVASLVTAAWLSHELVSTRGALSLATSELAATEVRLTDLEAELAATETELVEVGIQLDASRELAEYLQASLSNLQVNYDRLITGYGYVLRDPSYREMERFLADDETSRQEYAESEYTCVDFAADVKRNAANEGIRCAYVIIEFRGGGGHAIVAFDPTDRDGLVFIEPQFDWEVEPEVGRRYYECVRPPPGHYMAEPDYDDTITRIIVVW